MKNKLCDIINRIRNIKFKYEFWLPFVVSVISLVITGIISSAANKISETSMQINERNQYPHFQISAYYDEDNNFRGYNVTNTGGSVQFVHLEVDKYLHLQSIGTKTHDLIIPCAYSDAYYDSPTEIMKLPTYQIREYDEFWLPTHDTIETNLLDTTSLLDTLKDKLQENCFTAKYYTFNVLTVSYTDYNRVFHSERYLISSSPSSPNDYSLRFIDADEWDYITLRMPSEFVDDEYSIPATAQNENGATTGGTVRETSYIDILFSDVIEYMDSNE